MNDEANDLFAPVSSLSSSLYPFIKVVKTRYVPLTNLSFVASLEGTSIDNKLPNEEHQILFRLPFKKL